MRSARSQCCRRAEPDRQWAVYREAVSVEHSLHDGGAVDRHVQSLTDRLIGERRSLILIEIPLWFLIFAVVLGIVNAVAFLLIAKER
jgi:hypothetical protein